MDTFPWGIASGLGVILLGVLVFLIYIFRLD
jgi:hypothetical protein